MKFFKSLVELSVLVGVPLIIVLCYTLYGPTAFYRAHIAHSLAGDFMIAFVFAMIVLVAIQVVPIDREERHALSLLWMVRIGVTLGFGFYFDANHAFDAAVYYHVGKGTHHSWLDLSIGNGNMFMYLVVDTVTRVVDSFLLVKVVLSVLGLLATYVFYRAVVLYMGRPILPLLYMIGLFPSVLFWTSHIGKESMTILSYAVYFYGIAGFCKTGRSTYGIYIAAGLLGATLIRSWLGPIMLAPVVGMLVFSSRTPLVAKFGFAIMSVPAFLFTLQQFAENFRIESTSDLLERSTDLSQSWARGDTAQRLDGGFDSLNAMIAFMPLGTFTALFRPLLGEVSNLLGIFAGLENTVLFGFFLWGLWRHRLRWMSKPILLWAFLLFICWGAMYGFVSYQNLGTAFRFQTQVATFILLFVAYLVTAPREHFAGRYRVKHPWENEPPSRIGRSERLYGTRAPMPGE